ncbi:MAG: hypothetical protein VB878_10335, partial [Pirellulaceae bacterium]
MFRRKRLIAALAASLFFPQLLANAADEQFVGSLALAVRGDIAEKLKLDDTTREKLLDLIDRRESEAFKMAFELRDLPTVEVARRLEPFVAESERLGFVFLSLTQREMLKQILVAEQGMNSLAEEETAQILGLSKTQREQVAKLMSQRRGDLADAGGSQQRIT